MPGRCRAHLGLGGPARRHAAACWIRSPCNDAAAQGVCSNLAGTGNGNRTCATLVLGSYEAASKTKRIAIRHGHHGTRGMSADRYRATFAVVIAPNQLALTHERVSSRSNPSLRKHRAWGFSTFVVSPTCRRGSTGRGRGGGASSESMLSASMRAHAHSRSGWSAEVAP